MPEGAIVARSEAPGSPLFTVLLPIVRPPVFLPFAIESVLAQRVADFELFVVCDGAPPETVACAQDYARYDARVKVRPFPKGERHGEAHRHHVLAGASGRYVAHIGDDDLWLPNHLEEMAILLSTADFGHLLHLYIKPNGRVEILPADIALADTRQRMLTEKFNVFGLTFAGYRMDAYRRLPDGWTPAPADLWTDLHMWRKFLRVESLTFGTRAAVTAIHFAAPERLDFTLEQRREEIRVHWARVLDPCGRNEIVQTAWRSLLERTLQCDGELLALTRAHDALTVTRVALQAEVGRVTTSRDELQAELGHAIASCDELQADLGRANAVREELEARLARTTALLSTAEGEFGRILQSRSWRITAPLRRIFAVARSYVPRPKAR